MLPSATLKASASAILLLSRLNRPPCTIAVYASPWSSPPMTQHSLPGGRYPLPRPDIHRLDFASFLAHQCPNLNFRQSYSSYQIVIANRVCQPSASSLCSVIAVDVCVTETLEPRLFCHLLISDSSPSISLLLCTQNILTGIIDSLLLFDALILTDARRSLARAVLRAAVRRGGNSD